MSKCRYCNEPFEPIQDLREYPKFHNIVLRIDTEGPSLEIDFSANSKGGVLFVDTDINYCPICGRKLEETK